MATLIGTPQNTYTAASAGSINHSYGTAVQSGDVALVAGGSYHASATISSVTSSVSTSSIAEVGTLLRGTGSTAVPFLGVWLVVFSGSGTPTLTVNFSTPVVDRRISSIVYRGIHATTQLEATAGTAGEGPSGAVTVNSGDVVQANSGPVVGFVQEWSWPASHDPAVGTPTTGWTEWGETATGSDCKYQDFADTGTRVVSFAWTGNGQFGGWAVRGVALRNAAGGGGPTQGPRSIQLFRMRRR